MFPLVVYIDIRFKFDVPIFSMHRTCLFSETYLFTTCGYGWGIKKVLIKIRPILVQLHISGNNRTLQLSNSKQLSFRLFLRLYISHCIFCNWGNQLNIFFENVFMICLTSMMIRYVYLNNSKFDWWIDF